MLERMCRRGAEGRDEDGQQREDSEEKASQDGRRQGTKGRGVGGDKTAPGDAPPVRQGSSQASASAGLGSLGVVICVHLAGSLAL